MEDGRCNIEIDDTSLASAAAISRATDEFVAQNPALIGEIAALLTDAVGSDATIRAGKTRKTGVAAPLHVLILDMRLESGRGCSSESNASMAALLHQERIAYTLHSFSSQRSDEPGEAESEQPEREHDEQDSASLRMRVVNTLLNSTARLVHFECDLLPSGGDLVLQWVLEEVVLHDDAVRQLVLSSTSHHHLVDSKNLADSSALGQGHSGDTSWPHAHQLSHGSECGTSGVREGKGEEEDFGPWVDHSPHPRCCQVQEGKLIFLFYFARKTNLDYGIFFFISFFIFFISFLFREQKLASECALGVSKRCREVFV